MKRTLKETVLRAIILLVGLLIAHLGVTLFLLADLGSDPFNVLVQGLFHSLLNLTGFAFLTHGRVHIVVCFLIILVLLELAYLIVGWRLTGSSNGMIEIARLALPTSLLTGLCYALLVPPLSILLLHLGKKLLPDSTNHDTSNDSVIIDMGNNQKKKDQDKQK